MAEVTFGMTVPYIVLDRKAELGKAIYLYVGGTNDGWWLDEAHNPVRRADLGEIEDAKRKFWTLPAEGTS